MTAEVAVLQGRLASKPMAEVLANPLPDPVLAWFAEQQGSIASDQAFHLAAMDHQSAMAVYIAKLEVSKLADRARAPLLLLLLWARLLCWPLVKRQLLRSSPGTGCV